MASTDARPVPRKNTAYRITFPILDNTGALVSGASGLDSEVSKDGGTFADCTNEATQIATSSGIYYLDLTATEMNADTVAIIVKTSTTDAKTTVLVLYPEEAGDYRADVVQIAGSTVNTSAAQLGVNVVNAGGSAWATAIANLDVAVSTRLAPTTAGRTLDVSTGGEAGVDWANIGSPTTTVNLSGTTVKTATDVETDTADIQGRLPAALVSGRIDASVGAVASNAITAAALAADAGAEIADAVWDEALSGHSTPGSAGEALSGATAPSAADVADAVWDEALSGHTTSGSAGEGLSSASAPSAADVADAVWDEALSGHTTTGSAGAGLTAAGSAGDPWSTALPGAYSAGTAGYIIGNNLDIASSTILQQSGAAPTALPAANATLQAKIDFLFAMVTHETTLDRSSGEFNIKNEAGSASIGSYTAVDSGTIFTKGVMG